MSYEFQLPNSLGALPEPSSKLQKPLNDSAEKSKELIKKIFTLFNISETDSSLVDFRTKITHLTHSIQRKSLKGDGIALVDDIRQVETELKAHQKARGDQETPEKLKEVVLLLQDFFNNPNQSQACEKKKLRPSNFEKAKPPPVPVIEISKRSLAVTKQPLSAIPEQVKCEEEMPQADLSFLSHYGLSLQDRQDLDEWLSHELFDCLERYSAQDLNVVKVKECVDFIKEIEHLVEQTLKRIQNTIVLEKENFEEVKNQLKQTVNDTIDDYVNFSKYACDQSMWIDLEFLQSYGLTPFQIHKVYLSLPHPLEMKSLVNLRKEVDHLRQKEKQAKLFKDSEQEKKIKALLNEASNQATDQFIEVIESLSEKVIHENFQDRSEKIKDSIHAKLAVEIKNYMEDAIDATITNSFKEINSVLKFRDEFGLTDEDMRVCFEVYEAHKGAKKSVQRLLDSIFYQLGTQLPYLDTIIVTVNNTKKRLLSAVTKEIVKQLKEDCSAKQS